MKHQAVTNMASIRAYAAPLPGRKHWAIGLPPKTRRHLAGMAWWWAITAAPCHVDLFVASPIEDLKSLRHGIASSLRRAASNPLLSPTNQTYNSRRVLVMALAIWGWTLVLGSGGDPLATIAGLWLAIGLPFMRSYHDRVERRWNGVLNEALGSLINRCERPTGLTGTTTINQVMHPGLSSLEAHCEETGPSVRSALWHGCERADLDDLRPFYSAFLASAQSHPKMEPDEMQFWSIVQVRGADDRLQTAKRVGSEGDHRSL